MKLRDNTELVSGITEEGVFYPAKNLPSGTIRIVLGTACNFSCKYCFAEGEQPGERIISPESIQAVLEKAKEFGINKVKLTGGEPLLYPGLEDLIKKIKAMGIKYIDATTNASLLNNERLQKLSESGLDALTISLDSMKPERYKDFTGYGNFEQVMKNIKNAVKEFSGSIRLNWIVLEENTDETEDIISFSRENGIKLRLIEPTTVEDREITYDKTAFNMVMDEIMHKADRVLPSDCKSVIYCFFGDWCLTLMRNLCGNKLCDTCRDYMYVRLSSEMKLKPCLARRDTEVQIENMNDDHLEECFIKAISQMGVGLK